MPFIFNICVRREIWLVSLQQLYLLSESDKNIIISNSFLQTCKKSSSEIIYIKFLMVFNTIKIYFQVMIAVLHWINSRSVI